jgi:hypothetical protein
MADVGGQQRPAVERRPSCTLISRLPLAGLSSDKEPLSAGKAPMIAFRMLDWADRASPADVASEAIA